MGIPQSALRKESRSTTFQCFSVSNFPFKTSYIMPGYWKRPVGRMYAYNLDLGEHYYSPMTSYLESERGTRGETPGALTFSERLAKRWLNGRRYEAGGGYSRATSMAR